MYGDAVLNLQIISIFYNGFGDPATKVSVSYQYFSCTVGFLLLGPLIERV